MSTRADRAGAPGRLRLPRRRRGTPPRPRADRRGLWTRAVPVVIALLTLVATFGVILLMTVRITDGQYRLVELRQQEQALQQETESLTQDLEFHQAPQNLARVAQEEGLVPAPSEQGIVDLASGEVSGEAVPAADGDGEEIDIAIPPPVQSGSSAADEAQEEARARRDALPSSDEEAQDQLEHAREVESDVDLHGGTIPGPQQRSDGSDDSSDDEADDAGAGEDDAAVEGPGGSAEGAAAEAAEDPAGAPADGNPEAPEGHTPLSGPAQTPQPAGPVDADDPAAPAAPQEEAAPDGAPQDGSAQESTAQEGAGQ